MSSSLVANGLVLPADIWAHVGNFVSLTVAFNVYATCRALRDRYKTVVEFVFVQPELARMGFASRPLRGRLTMGFFADFLWQRTPAERRVIQANLLVRPLEWFHRLQPVLVVLEEAVSQASDDPQKLLELERREEGDRALILSNRVLFLTASHNHQDRIEGIQDANNAFFCPLPTFPNLVIQAISKIMGSEESEFREALPALLRLRMGLRRRELSVQEAVDIIYRFVGDTCLRDDILKLLVLEEVEPGRSLETSTEIVLKITDPKLRVKTLRALAVQAKKDKVPVDAILKMILTVLKDQSDDRDSCLCALLKTSPDLDPSAANEMAILLNNKEMQEKAFEIIKQRKEASEKRS